jgi:hypothetical protein
VFCEFSPYAIVQFPRLFLFRVFLQAFFVNFSVSLRTTYFGGCGRVVGIATGYGVDGSGVETRWTRNFPCPSGRARGPPSLLHNGYGVLTRVKVTWTSFLVSRLRMSLRYTFFSSLCVPLCLPMRVMPRPSSFLLISFLTRSYAIVSMRF